MHYLNIVGYYRKKRILKELKQIINLFILLFVIKRSRSSVWLERLTVTQEVASSSLVDSAKKIRHLVNILSAFYFFGYVLATIIKLIKIISLLKSLKSNLRFK